VEGNYPDGSASTDYRRAVINKKKGGTVPSSPPFF
jgi:hypothetical protein